MPVKFLKIRLVVGAIAFVGLIVSGCEGVKGQQEKKCYYSIVGSSVKCQDIIYYPDSRKPSLFNCSHEVVEIIEAVNIEKVCK